MTENVGLVQAYKTNRGTAYIGDSMRLLHQLPEASINLVITSPPFALQRQKDYGNLSEFEYVDWLISFAHEVMRILKDDGSFVIDMGGAYRKGVPSRSLYQFRTLIRMCDEVGFHLAQDFYWNNPSKLPSPIEWVNKRKIRVKDSVNNIWWLSKSIWPKANIRSVLTPYSNRMKKLLENPEIFYTPQKRPSGHAIGKGFAKDNGGAIPSSLINLPNTESNGQYDAFCKIVGASRHPARFPAGLPEFFIKMLTEPNDTILDIFAGSNVTGQVSEALERKWLSCELKPDYVACSLFRFMEANSTNTNILSAYKKITTGRFYSLTDEKM